MRSIWKRIRVSVSLWLLLLWFCVYDPASVEVVVWAVHEAVYPYVDTTMMDSFFEEVKE